MNARIVGVLFVVFIHLTAPSGAIGHIDYCKLNNNHTMCLYKTISKNCVQYKTESAKVVRQILDDHNKARSTFAGGLKGYFVPNMLKMYWDQELADLSARWACQCKATVDANRVVTRFKVGQIVWTVLQPHNFTRWSEIWKYIIAGGTGFYQRDYWGRMITKYDPADPLSFIYNPYVRFLGCTLAKYLIWSVEESSFGYSTTLVCNYGPVQDSYVKYPKEDWPCRGCPAGKPCFTKFYMRGHIMPPNLSNERNLCIDPLLEYQHPKPGKHCPVDRHGEKHEFRIGARKLDPKYWNDVETSHRDSDGRKQDIDSHEGLKKYNPLTMKNRKLDPNHVTVVRRQNVSLIVAGSTTPIIPNYDYPEEPLSSTERGPVNFDPLDYIDETTKLDVNHTTSTKSGSIQTTKKIITTKQAKGNSEQKPMPSSVSTRKPTTVHNVTNTTSQDSDKFVGYHDPSEEDDENHGPMDSDGHINYCEVRCSVRVKHTLCKYNGTSSDCKRFTSMTTSMTQDDLLRLHNEFRDAYTEGSTKPPHPLVSNMARIRWSKELESSAHMWLRQCKLDHDVCRDSLLKSPGDLFNQWKAQAVNFSSKGMTDYLSFSNEGRPKVDDFVQLIWAHTYYVGCAYGTFEPSPTTGVAVLICNYAPLGKEVSRSIYIPGGPCSNCFTETSFAHGHCSRQDFPNLCDDKGIAHLPSLFTILFMSFTPYALLEIGLRDIFRWSDSKA